MNSLVRALKHLSAELDAEGRAWALVGGLAVSARAEPRTTRDIDAAVSVASDADAEALIHALLGRGYRTLCVLEQTSTGRLSTIRLARDRAGIVVDLLFASSGIEREIAAKADLLEILPGVRVPVARVGHLIATKILARDDRRRPQDADDLRALLVVATGADKRDARRAVALIEKRGFARGKNLTKALEKTFMRN